MTPVSIPAYGGTLLVLPAFVLSAPIDAFGQAHIPVPLADNPAYAGVQIYFQGLFVDPGAPQIFAMTAGATAAICP